MTGKPTKLSILEGALGYYTSGKIGVGEKVLASLLVLGYIVWPIDLIPDVPVIGWLDDIGVGALFLAYCNWRCSKAIAEEGKAAKSGEADPMNRQEKEVFPAEPGEGDHGTPQVPSIHAKSGEESIFSSRK